MNVLAMQRWIGCDSFCVTEKEIESSPQKYYVQYLFNMDFQYARIYRIYIQ